MLARNILECRPLTLLPNWMELAGRYGDSRHNSVFLWHMLLEATIYSQGKGLEGVEANSKGKSPAKMGRGSGRGVRTIFFPCDHWDLCDLWPVWPSTCVTFDPCDLWGARRCAFCVLTVQDDRNANVANQGHVLKYGLFIRWFQERGNRNLGDKSIVFWGWVSASPILPLSSLCQWRWDIWARRSSGPTPCWCLCLYCHK